MTLKKRVGYGTVGAVSTTIVDIEVSLGATYGEVIKLEVKGDDANVEATATIIVNDAEGRIIFSDTGLDFGADDGTVKNTGQFYGVTGAPVANTVGLGITLTPVEEDISDRLGDPSANTEGAGGAGIPAKSPLTVHISSGTDGDRYQVAAFVRV